MMNSLWRIHSVKCYVNFFFLMTGNSCSIDLVFSYFSKNIFVYSRNRYEYVTTWFKFVFFCLESFSSTTNFPKPWFNFPILRHVHFHPTFPLLQLFLKLSLLRFIYITLKFTLSNKYTLYFHFRNNYSIYFRYILCMYFIQTKIFKL